MICRCGKEVVDDRKTIHVSLIFGVPGSDLNASQPVLSFPLSSPSPLSSSSSMTFLLLLLPSESVVNLNLLSGPLEFFLDNEGAEAELAEWDRGRCFVSGVVVVDPRVKGDVSDLACVNSVGGREGDEGVRGIV